MDTHKICWKLFSSAFVISAFTFGGGYVIVPLMKKKFTDTLGWLSEEEMLELVAVGQSSPGAVAINTATLVGWRMAGFPGAVTACLGTALPPLIILSLVCILYDRISGNAYVQAAMRCMQAGISAVIADVVLGMALPYFKDRRSFSIAVMVCVFVAAWFFSVNVAVIIIVCGAAGAARAIVNARRKGGAA